MTQILGNPNFLRGLFSILLVAMFLAIFELTFYCTIAVPQINEQIDKLSNSFNLSTPPLLFDSVTRVTKGIAVNDQENANYTNSLKIAIMVIFICIIFLLLTWTYTSLRRHTQGTKYKTDISPVFVSSIMTIILIIGFQIFMFFFSKKYKYASKEELELYFVNSLLTTQGRENELIPLPSETNLSP